MTEAKNKFHQEKDILAISLLNSFLPKKVYMPYTSSSLSFESIRIIANDSIVNQRGKILEFGAGISTLILGALLEKTNPAAKLISIDENESWAKLVQEYLKIERINTVEIIHKPLNTVKNSEYFGWYEPLKLKEEIKTKVNLVVVDGPSAWQKDRSHIRIHALDFLIKNNLLDTESFAIYLDDCHRSGEKKIISLWAEKLGCKYQIINDNLGKISFNDSFNNV